MTRLGVHEGKPVVVDLRDQLIGSWDEMWDALTVPCGLPDWFGRNLNAWNDTLGEGAISPILDAHPYLVVQVAEKGLFAPGGEGAAFVEVTAGTGEGHVEVEDRP